MNTIEMLSEEDVYYIALLVKKGWERIYENAWRHPDDTKYRKTDWDGKVISEDSYWPFDEACNEAERDVD